MTTLGKRVAGPNELELLPRDERQLNAPSPPLTVFSRAYSKSLPKAALRSPRGGWRTFIGDIRSGMALGMGASSLSWMGNPDEQQKKHGECGYVRSLPAALYPFTRRMNAAMTTDCWLSMKPTRS